MTTALVIVLVLMFVLLAVFPLEPRRSSALELSSYRGRAAELVSTRGPVLAVVAADRDPFLLPYVLAEVSPEERPQALAAAAISLVGAGIGGDANVPTSYMRAAKEIWNGSDVAARLEFGTLYGVEAHLGTVLVRVVELETGISARTLSGGGAAAGGLQGLVGR